MKAQLLRNKPGMPRLAALILVMVLSTLGTKAFAEEIEVDNLKYTISENTATVTGFASTPSGEIELTIPETVGDNIPVTSIKNEAFDQNTKITSVTFGKNVTTVGDYAFRNCSSIKKVIIEDLKVWCQIDFVDGATNPLGYAKHLYLKDNDTETEVTTLSEENLSGVTKIGKSAFYNCEGLTSVAIPSGVTSIGHYAFEGCSGLTTITIPEGVTSIGNGAFHDCAMTTLVIPNSVTTIEWNAFRSCAKLESVTISDEVTNIGNNLFSSCTSLKSVVIPDKVTRIDRNAFNGCTGLETVTIGSGVENIGEGSFQNCSALKTITSKAVDPPSIVTSSGGLFPEPDFHETKTATFDGVTVSNVTLYVPAGSGSDYEGKAGWSGFKIEEQTISAESNGVLIYYQYTDDDKDSLEVVKGESNYEGAIVIPSTITYNGKVLPVRSIGDLVFKGNNAITSVVIGDNVAEIAAEAFYQCGYLESVTIGSGVTIIGNHAFYECKKLKTLVMGSKVKSIGAKAFGYCEALTSVSIPNTVSEIGDNAFTNCKALGGTVEIPSGVTVISDNVFSDCKNLTGVTISENVTSIGSNAFSGCSSLTSVTIPSKVTSISSSAFGSCTSLESINIPEGVTQINACTFYKCSGLASITIPSSVTSIEAGAFDGCTGLTTVTSLNPNPPTVTTNQYLKNFDSTVKANAKLYVPAASLEAYQTADEWKDFTYKESLSEEEEEEESPIKYNLINDKRALEVTKKDGGYSGSINIPATAKYNGSELPVTKIGTEAFKNCTELTSIEIPSSVTSIGASAFSGCSSLTKVIVRDIAAWCGINFEGDNESNPLSYAKHLYSDGEKEIKDLEIPNDVTTIGTFAFYNCEGLTSVTIPSSVTSIGEYAFSGCTNITKVTSNIQAPFAIKSNVFNQTVKETATLKVPEKTRKVYSEAEGWKEFKNIDDGTKEEEEEEEEKSPLEYNLINDGRALEVTKKDGGYSGSINIPASAKYGDSELPVTSIGTEAFKDCTGLTSVTIPSSVTNIGYRAFYGCAALGTITSLSEEPPSVGEYAFYGCYDIETIYVPKKSVSKYQDAGFWGDYNIVALPGDDDEEEEEEEDEAEEEDTEPDISERNDDGKIVYFNFADNTQEVKVTKGDYWGVVSIPETVHNIPVTGIESDAFSGCTDLTGVEIPRSVTNIGDNAFNGCSALEAITIRSTIEAIGAGAFDGCTALEKVVAEDIPAWCNISFGNETANPLTQAGHLYSDEDTEIKSLVISENVENIGAHAFAGGIGLESVTILDGAKNIGAGAFDGCVNITAVTIPSSVESIGSDAFSDCIGLKKVVAEDIAAWCDISFGNVSANPLSRAGHIYSDDYTEITDLTIPNTVQGIGAAAFAGGIGLRSVTIGSDPESDLKSMEYYDGVKDIGNSAFYGCSNLISVTLRSSVESIGAFAFCDCDRLDSIAIPSGVKAIGDMAFYCSNITKVVSHIQEPFAIKASVFGGNTLMNGTLYVPDETIMKYKSTAGWKEFRHIVGGISTGIEDINAEKVTIQANNGALNISGVKDGTRITVYSMTGAKVCETTVAGGTVSIPTSLRKGEVAIIRIGDTAVKVLMQ